MRVRRNNKHKKINQNGLITEMGRILHKKVLLYGDYSNRQGKVGNHLGIQEIRKIYKLGK